MNARSPRPEADGFFALRTPLWPVDEIASWSTGLRVPSTQSDDPELPAAVAHDARMLEERVREKLGDVEVLDAIFCASPSLSEGVEAWLRDPKSARAHDVPIVAYRYLTRMAYRATPFGLFSGCSVGKNDRATVLALGPRGAYQRRTRLDMHYLTALVDALERDPAIRAELSFRPSSGLYGSGDQYRYAEARVDEKSGRTYHLVSVDRSPAVDAALARAAAGATCDEIAAAIAASERDIAFSEARSFTDELVEAQMLRSDLEPPITGSQAIDHVTSTLASIPSGAGAATVTRRVRELLEEIDRDGIGVDPARYRAIRDELATLPASVDLSLMLQIDLFKPVRAATLGGRALAEIGRGVEILRRLGSRRPETQLDEFCDAFVRRWEAQAVPLVEALDEERGIGFGSKGVDPSPLLEGLDLPPGPATGRPSSARDEWLLGRWSDLVGAGRQELELTDADVAELEASPPPRLPPHFSALVQLAARTPAELAAGELRVLLGGISVPNGGVFFGRFCYGDPELARGVEGHLRREEAAAPDAVFAEVVHLPEGRLGNILCRPVLRAHEIPYLGRSGAPRERQIPIGDLLVSVQGRRARLWSRKLEREVRPRLTNAHNHATSTLGVYRFLCALQTQDLGYAFGWDWGRLDGAPSLPRVSSGKVVLSLARWRLRSDELAPVVEARGAERVRRMRALRERRHLPRRLQVVDRDNVLTVDLEHVLSLDGFAALVKRRQAVIVQEPFASDDELVVTGPEGRFHHEIVVPFAVAREPERAPSALRRVEARRTFVPAASSWAYAKLYAGTAGVDALIRHELDPLVAELRALGADRWFFLRYQDPDWHLRLRFHGPEEPMARDVVPALCRRFGAVLARGGVTRIVLDTYEREIERYGGERAIEIAEAIFCADSEAAAAIVRAGGGDDAAEARWRLALLGMHLMLDDFGMPLPRRIALLDGLRESFASEHRVDAGVERRLGDRYRKVRGELEALISAPLDHGAAGPLAAGVAALLERSRAIAPHAVELDALERAGALGVPLEGIASSHLHMHANRVLQSEQRAQELVLYDLLLRLYRSRAARERGKGS